MIDIAPLVAQIEADEAAARAAAEGVGDEHYHTHYAEHENTWVMNGPRGGFCCLPSDDELEPWGPLVDRFVPARVLAECEGKRSIIAQWQEAVRLYEQLCDDGDDQRWEYLFRSEALEEAVRALIPLTS